MISILYIPVSDASSHSTIESNISKEDIDRGQQCGHREGHRQLVPGFIDQEESTGPGPSGQRQQTNVEQEQTSQVPKVLNL